MHFLAKLAPVLLSLTVVACAGVQGFDDRYTRFTVNGTTQYLGQVTQEAYLMAWKEEAEEKFKQSALGRREKEWARVYVGRAVSLQFQPPCRDLDIQSISNGGITPFMVIEAGTSEVTYTPKTFMEIWIVSSCGRTSKWRIFDVHTTGNDDLRVLGSFMP